MNLQSIMDQEFGSWQVEGLPRRIEYSLAMLEELRVYADEGFQKIPHGGIEVGAILLGEHDEAKVRIVEWRPMACDHARGPGFALSDSDRQALTESIEQCGKSPELQGLVIVGWFHTHTRTKIFLSAEDQTIHESFFGEPWQIAMVMRPQKDQPASTGFFCKDGAGVMNGEDCLAEFAVRPDVKQSLKPRRASAAAPPNGGRIKSGKPENMAGLPEGVARHERPMFRPAGDARLPTEGSGVGRSRHLFEPASDDAGGRPMGGRPRLATMPTPVAAAAEPITPPPSWLTQRTMWAASALLLAVALGGGLHLWRQGQTEQNAALKIEEADQSLQISWDNAAPAVASADRAVLRIVDGSTVRNVPLSLAAVRNGAVTYMRQADDVEVRLTLFRDNRQSSQGFARYVGSAGSATGTGVAAGGLDTTDAPSQQRLQLQSDLTRLRESLREESERAERLREELTLLERTARVSGLKLPQGAAGPRVTRQ